MPLGIGGLTGGGVSSSANSSVGDRALKQALESAINQDNAVFVGGSGRATNSKTVGNLPNQPSDKTPLYIAGGVLAVALLLMAKKG